MSGTKWKEKGIIWITFAMLSLALLMWGNVVNAADQPENSGTEQPTDPSPDIPTSEEPKEETKQEKKDFGDEKLFTFTEVKNQTYTGTAICPEITVTEMVTEESTDNGQEETGQDNTKITTKTLELNKDYTVTYSNNINAGKAEITVKPVDTDKYSGEKKITFTINPLDINDLEIAEQERVYKGIATKPDMQVYFNGKRLTRGTDYHVGHYKNNQNVGTASCLVKGDGNFTGSRTVTFKIVPKELYNLDFSDISVRTYTGSAIKPKVTIKDTEISPAATLIQNKDYTISYVDNVRVGTAGVLISGTGNYTGSKVVTFKIRPAATKLLKLTKGKKKIKVKWTKKTAQITGYEIQYSTSSKFTKAKKVKAKKTYSTKTLTKLKGKKKYYVRVRTYKSVAGIKYYSKWSNVKSITTKK